MRDAKVKLRQRLLETGDAYEYAEPEKEVVSRSGDRCVVALTDQWYINYAEAGWKQQVREHIQGTLHTYSTDTQNRFEKAIEWLGDWACSRSFGMIRQQCRGLHHSLSWLSGRACACDSDCRRAWIKVALG